jgi:glycosyltransferase involved in cell wall biosynthesis
VRVTVAIPTYNYARFLREAIGSVQAQTFQDFEILVIDDGSTDETQEVLSTIRDDRLRVIRTEHRGISASRNEGLARAKGEFIAFLDADDRWRPTKLELQMQMMDGDADLVAVFTNFVRFDERGTFPLDQFTFFPELPLIPTVASANGPGRRIITNVFCSLVSFDQIPAWGGTMLFRTRLLRGLTFSPQLAVCEDLHFCLRSFRRGAVGYLSDPLVEVRRHTHNATRPAIDMPLAKLTALRMLLDEDLSGVERVALQTRIGRAWNEVGANEAKGRRLTAAVRAHLNAMRARRARLTALKGLLLLPLRALADQTEHGVHPRTPGVAQASSSDDATRTAESHL